MDIYVFNLYLEAHLIQNKANRKIPIEKRYSLPEIYNSVIYLLFTEYLLLLTSISLRALTCILYDVILGHKRLIRPASALKLWRPSVPKF